MVPTNGKVGIVSLKHPTQALVLITKRPGPHTSADTADCFERPRDTIFGGALSKKRSATPISYKVSQCPTKLRTSNFNLKNASPLQAYDCRM
jgi:hypothetical protein